MATLDHYTTGQSRLSSGYDAYLARVGTCAHCGGAMHPVAPYCAAPERAVTIGFECGAL